MKKGTDILINIKAAGINPANGQKAWPSFVEPLFIDIQITGKTF